MFKYLPEIISSYFIAREMGASAKGAHFWEAAYHAINNELVTAKNEIKAEQDLTMRLREEAVANHNNVVELMHQVQDGEKEKLALIKAYTSLIEQLDDLGYDVDDNNNIFEKDDTLEIPEEIEVQFEPEQVDTGSPLDNEED